MGIRYEKDRVRPTNGTVIFFSIYRDEAFQEELRGAFYSNLSFYAYREPGSEMISFGSSEGYLEGIDEPGFIIGSFLPALPVLTIPYKGTKKRDENRSIYTFPTASTTYEDYKHEVDEIISAIASGECDKVVAARVIVANQSVDIAEKFYDLCERFPDAFIFCFGTPATGCWIGASPELLLRGREKRIFSMALAGTRPTGKEECWDKKNLEEQRYVKDYIAEVMRRHGVDVAEGDTYTKQAGVIEHICTPIEGTIENGDVDLESLLKDLSPTPALCGTPKDKSLQLIKNLEYFDRGCYGGFCGPFRSLHDFNFHVVLRCASVTRERECVYAGGGITAASEVEKEWQETEMKASGILKP